MDSFLNIINYLGSRTDGMEYFRDLTNKFSYIKDFDSAVKVFNVLAFHQQMILGVMAFGLFVVLYVFIVATFTDNHE